LRSRTAACYHGRCKLDVDEGSMIWGWVKATCSGATIEVTTCSRATVEDGGMLWGCGLE
jgi:hypothetical protein